MVGREYDESPSVDDTIDELKDWASFREDELENGNELEYENDMEPDEWSRPRPSPPPVTPPLVLYPDKSDRVGRNDPCPCGSGKKHKRCCMRSR
jgi:preprotein translocase subunit SecA